MNKYQRRLFIGTTTGKKSGITEGKVEINYANNTRQNTDLNRIRYVRECLYSNSADEENEWAEIMVVKNGLNYSADAIIYGDVSEPELINDDNIYSMTTATKAKENNSCVTIDLGQLYDVDYIYVWHNFGDKRTYLEREISVSADDQSYRVVDNYEVAESEKGINVSAYEQSKVMLLGNIYYPVKKKYGKTWVRLFHHNNRNGTILWDARVQVLNNILNNKGYKEPYRISGLAFLKNFVRGDGYYELMIEYPELNKGFSWAQKNNFTDSTSPGTYIKSSSNNLDNDFSGLKKSDSVNTVIDSTSGKYQIGALKSTNGGIVGYSGSITGTVDLWVRIK